MMPTSNDCPVCGMAREAWKGNQGQGVINPQGELCCCEGCARGSGCTCESEEEVGGMAPEPRQRAAEWGSE